MAIYGGVQKIFFHISNIRETFVSPSPTFSSSNWLLLFSKYSEIMVVIRIGKTILWGT